MLTISEAAKALGISENATKAEINSAYRDAISKYHPDANRTKPESERKHAEEMFKKVGEARKVMLNPSLADPEPSGGAAGGSSMQQGSRATQQRGSQSQPSSASVSASTGNRARSQGRTTAGNAQGTNMRASASSGSAYSSSSGNGRASVQGTRGRQGYQASAETSKFSPQGHNTSRSFNNEGPRVVDPAEESLAEIYREETRKEHLSFLDKIRVTPSSGVSLAFLVFAIAIAVTGATSIESLVNLSAPPAVFAIICAAKLVVYDTFASYYVHKALKGRFEKGTWALLCGAECALLALIGLVLLGAAPVTGPLAGLVVPVLASALAIGAVTAAVAVLLSKGIIGKKGA